MNKASILLLMVVFSSCYTLQNAKRDLDKVNRNYPILTTEYCAKEFPVKKEYIKGDTITKRDTVTTVGDSIPCPPQTDPTKLVKVKCPDQKIVYINTHSTDTFYGENAANLAIKDSLIADCQRSEFKATERIKISYWIIGILSVILLVIVAFTRIRKSN